MEQARRAIEREQSRLTTLCQEAGCADPQQLPALEQRVNDGRQLKRDLETNEKQLRALAAGRALEELVAEADDADAGQLAEQIQQLSRQAESLEQEKSELHETVGQERTILEGMNGSADAADAACEAQQLLAEMEADVEQYVRTRLASVVLRSAVERYRERHQGPLLRTASELFAELTLGSFSGLKPLYNDQGQAVLTGVRPDGQEVPVTAMSDGTADQLYLALRLASLREYFETHPPIPLILDDILINFDNGRSAAALDVLARWSQQTQVIFFTHHQHLLDIAETTLPADRYKVHTLGEEPLEAVAAAGAGADTAGYRGHPR